MDSTHRTVNVLSSVTYCWEHKKLVNLYRTLVNLRQSVDNCREVKSQHTEILFQRMAALYFNFHVRMKREDVNGLHEINW